MGQQRALFKKFLRKVNQMAKSKSDETIGYAQALEELESILAELEENDVDVDKLATHVQRASQLIELCRDRIGNAKLKIEEVVKGLSQE
ncbi:MAG: exodeoxyribonuclease VII small subunit [Actinobacteria bacterium]|nr:exodeoxyribonuclease VII small subunit [Actinomycetota bacterium]